MAGLFRSSRGPIALTLVLLAFGALAQEQRTSTEGGEWLEKSRSLIEESANDPPPEWMNATPSDEAIAIAEEIARDSGMRPDRPDRPKVEIPGTVLIFGSFSLPEETLRNLLYEATESDAVFVLRGLVGGTNVRETIRRITALRVDPEKVPNVIIDPTLYKRFNVTVAPTLVLVRDGGLPPVTVAGAVTVDYVRRRARGMGPDSNPDLGTRAETHEIAELDLIVEMQRRLASIDWTKRRQEAIDRFWRTKSDFVDLPTATEDRQFEIDPTIRVTNDISDADGRVLVQAGETFNPLDLIPLSKTVVVFRGTDPDQVAIASRLAGEVRGQGRGVILLTTTVNTEDGWKSMHGMEQDLRGPVYLLQANLAERFKLQHVPSTVTSRGNRLVITEVAVRRQNE